MQAENFYTNEKINLIPLKFISRFKLSQLQLTKAVKNLLEGLKFNAQAGEVAPIFDANGNITEVFVGMGEEGDNDFLAKSVKNLPVGKYEITEKLADNILLSWALEQYKFIRYKEYIKEPKVLFLTNDIYSSIICKAQAIFLIRDLINTPTCDLGPAELAIIMREMAEESSAEFTEIIGEELLKNNFPAIYTVGRGSNSKPRLLSLTWGNDKHPKVSLVGKGVCFDSGGLNIKSSAGMNMMKKDMGGAAHVIGLAKWIMAENLPIKLQVLVPAVENSVDGNSYRPGDVIKMRNELTVEVDNTDAEGRLVLADALCKACEDKPDVIFDFATLTGAARIAVGTEIAAMFCNDDKVAEELYKNSSLTMDPIWRMPLFPQYNTLFDSDIADMSNIGKSSYAGAIIAALFLQRFINKDIPWVHFDMMAWNLSTKPGKPVGGEAMGFLTVAKYLEANYRDKN